MGDPKAAAETGLIKPGYHRFQDLMQRRVRRILLVSSLYDSFILVEDGQLNEALLRQFVDLNIAHNPDLIRVSTGAQALEMASRGPRFDLVITSVHVDDMDAAELGRRIKEAGGEMPVVLLGYNNRELVDFMARTDLSGLDRVFLWQGDVRILLAVVKYVEDRLNLEHDSGVLGVPVILVVEDNVRFYSSFLPAIYTELVNHSHKVISEGLNLTHKVLRTRARPKVVLCTTYDEAWYYFEKYDEQILGVISDIEFPRGGELFREAGVELSRQVRKRRADIPIVLQSSIPKNRELAEAVGARFLLKGSPTLLRELRKVLLEDFGFGDFVFRLADGKPIARAQNLKELVAKLETVPAETLAYHGDKNHFSMWLKARTEFRLADKLRPRKVSEYESLEHLRREMIKSIGEYQRARDRVIVADFDRGHFEKEISISRIGGGSLGGKARGLAFVNRLLNESDLVRRYPEIRISVPHAVVVGTDVFDQFLEQNDLRDFALQSRSDREVESRFLFGSFPDEALADLRAFLEHVHCPLAVRSSGLLEDSPDQPFAGIYQTFMLPNNDPDPDARLIQLIAAVKRVYASTFTRQAKDFLEVTPYRLEEEKMAVIIQKLVGRQHLNRFYPDFSGVARSHNFYPTEPLTAQDGIVAVALGMGKTVVDGANCMRFCPKYPQHLVAFSSVDDVLKNSQREFFALDLDDVPDTMGKDLPEGAELRAFGLQHAEQDGTLARLASTYSPDNDMVYDGTSRPGVRLVSFAPVLKHEAFPLAALLDDLLALGSAGTSSPVEIEFAVNLSVPPTEQPEFGFLQMRPLALTMEAEELEIGHVLSSDLVCRSARVLGNGLVDTLCDIVVVDYHRFDRTKSLQVADEVARFNTELHKEGRQYLLVGVGRWGSSDPYLGIPVGWNQIAGARVIVESGFKDFKVTPSQGTHFFQNLTSCNVGYFTVNPEAGEGYVDWDWLNDREAVGETSFVRRIRLESPLTVKMAGQKGEGVILKPGENDG